MTYQDPKILSFVKNNKLQSGFLLIALILSFIPLFINQRHATHTFSTPEGEDISVLSWSPDSSKLAIGTITGTVFIMDTNNGTILRTLTHGDPIINLAWSPDSSKLVSCDINDSFTIWHTISGTVLLRVKYPYPIWGVFIRNLWSFDSNKIAIVTYANTLDIWDINSRTITTSLQFSDETIRFMAWSPVEDNLAVVSVTGKVSIWDINTQTKLQEFIHLTNLTKKPETGNYSLLDGTLAWSPDGSRLAQSYLFNPEIVIWNVTTASIFKTWLPSTYSQNAFNGTLTLQWNPKGTQIFALFYNSSEVDFFGLLLTTIKPIFRIWDVEKESEITTFELPTFVEHEYNANNRAWKPNGKRISYSRSGNLIVVLDINKYEFINFIFNFLPSTSDNLFTNLIVNVEILILLVIVIELFSLIKDLRIWRKEQGTTDEH
ncbi:MAG: WD40 repeat domain-containing protein [Candidatus Hodarchaeota archaeon]